VQTYARVGRPSRRTRTRWRFGSKRRLVATIEWLLLCPKLGFFPQTAQILAMSRKSVAMKRCGWVPADDPPYVAYHDDEWGVPSFDDRHLYEMLTLEGAQAGLSWRTILLKRDGYRKAFASFDATKVARFDRRKVERLMQDAGIVRNRLKIESTIANAKAIQKLDEGLSDYLWSFVDGSPIQNRWRRMSDLPAETAESKAMSKELKRRGFRFVGPTVCYAFMQAVGMVNDHEVSCFRYPELSRA
jgi:DNA-3-methyladenine glycosylase I